MADKDKREKRVEKGNKTPKNFFQKIGVFAVAAAKKMKSFFSSLKAELKRVVWPDKKRLIQNTATVLAICLIAGLILFIVDSVLGGILEGVGFYTPNTTTVATTTVVPETTTSVTPAASASSSTGSTAAVTTTAGTTASK